MHAVPWRVISPCILFCRSPYFQESSRGLTSKAREEEQKERGEGASYAKCLTSGFSHDRGFTEPLTHLPRVNIHRRSGSRIDGKWSREEQNVEVYINGLAFCGCPRNPDTKRVQRERRNTTLNRQVSESSSSTHVATNHENQSRREFVPFQNLANM